jgi:hypothetical protein
LDKTEAGKTQSGEAFQRNASCAPVNFIVIWFSASHPFDLIVCKKYKSWNRSRSCPAIPD